MCRSRMLYSMDDLDINFQGHQCCKVERSCQKGWKHITLNILRINHIWISKFIPNVRYVKAVIWYWSFYINSKHDKPGSIIPRWNFTGTIADSKAWGGLVTIPCILCRDISIFIHINWSMPAAYNISFVPLYGRAMDMVDTDWEIWC